jgi:hypothetical protein
MGSNLWQDKHFICWHAQNNQPQDFLHDVHVEVWTGKRVTHMQCATHRGSIMY